MDPERGMTESLGEQRAGAGEPGREGGRGPKESEPRRPHRSPIRASWIRIRRSGSRPIGPIHAEAVAALVTLYVLGLPRHILALVAPRAHEMRLVHHAPGLGPVLAHVDIAPGHSHLDLVHVQHDPFLAVVFHDPVPRPPPQAFLFRAGAVAPSPSDVGHALLLYFLGGPFPHEHEDRRLRYNQVLLDRKSTRLNSSHLVISYAVFCLKKKKINHN